MPTLCSVFLFAHDVSPHYDLASKLPSTSSLKRKSDHIKVFIFNKCQWHPFVEGIQTQFGHKSVTQLLIDFEVLKGHDLPGKLGRAGSR